MENYPVNESVEVIFNGASLRHEFHEDKAGFYHRLALGDRKGEWTGYAFIATITNEVNKREFAATTNYYAGTLPAVFEIIPGRAL